MTEPLTLRSALRARYDQWVFQRREPMTDEELAEVIRSVIPFGLAAWITPETRIDPEGLWTLAESLEYRGFNREGSAYWIVAPEFSTPDVDVTPGVAFCVSRILTTAESLIRDRDAHHFPNLLAAWGRTPSEVRGWLDDCVRQGVIPESALGRFPKLHELTTIDLHALRSIANPLTDHGWSVEDLFAYVGRYVRDKDYLDGLVRTTVAALTKASWEDACKTVERIRFAADGLPWRNARS